MRSICGWREPFLTSRSSATRMTPFVTARAPMRRRRYGARLPTALRPASWCCILRRQKSSTAKMRGNVHSADGWRAVLEPVIARYRGNVKRLYFRGDAAFTNPEIYEFLEAEGIGYTIRLPPNRILQDKIGYLVKRPVG